MNNLIKDQLKDCKHALLPYWDDDTTEIVIRKGDIKRELKFDVGLYFQIEIPDSLVHPTEESTLAKNWNGNTTPPSTIFNCVVQQVMGKMVKVDGVGVIGGVATNLRWNGWLPIGSVKILGEI